MFSFVRLSISSMFRNALILLRPTSPGWRSEIPRFVTFMSGALKCADFVQTDRSRLALRNTKFYGFHLESWQVSNGSEKFISSFKLKYLIPSFKFRNGCPYPTPINQGSGFTFHWSEIEIAFLSVIQCLHLHPKQQSILLNISDLRYSLEGVDASRTDIAVFFNSKVWNFKSKSGCVHSSWSLIWRFKFMTGIYILNFEVESHSLSVNGFSDLCRAVNSLFDQSRFPEVKIKRKPKYRFEFHACNTRPLCLHTHHAIHTWDWRQWLDGKNRRMNFWSITLKNNIYIAKIKKKIHTFSHTNSVAHTSIHLFA